MEVLYILIPQFVKVRKYKVNEEGLKRLLKENKKFSNKEIAAKLNVQLTKVEHWFRSDEYFCIPDAENWLELKKLLEIKTDEFDREVMEFEEKLGTFDMAERTYLTYGIAPALLSNCVDSILVWKKTE